MPRWTGLGRSQRRPLCTCGSGRQAQGYWPDLTGETLYCFGCIADKAKQADKAVRALASGRERPRDADSARVEQEDTRPTSAGSARP